MNFYFQNFDRKGNISQKYKKKTAILTKNDEKKRRTTNIVKNGRTRDEKYEASYRGNNTR